MSRLHIEIKDTCKCFENVKYTRFNTCTNVIETFSLFACGNECFYNVTYMNVVTSCKTVTVHNTRFAANKSLTEDSYYSSFTEWGLAWAIYISKCQSCRL